MQVDGNGERECDVEGQRETKGLELRVDSWF